MTRKVIRYTMEERDLIGKIIAFEDGELDEEETIELMQILIDTGVAWKLQGFYGRMANNYIEAGLCTPAGE